MARVERRAGRRARGPGVAAPSLRIFSATIALALMIAGCSGPAVVQPGDSLSVPSTETSARPTSTSTGQQANSVTRSTASGVPLSPTANPSAAGLPAAEFSAALVLLATLPVKGRAPSTGYSRDQFGQAWSDDVTVDGGHNGCDTRNDILRRDLIGTQLKDGTQGCVVLSGTLLDQYTGESNDFVRGPNSDDVQIDHLVSLSDAWATGAQQITAEQRQNLANDPLNLQAVAGPVNQSKGAGDAATWLPPDKAYRCTYLSRQVEVKAKYQLWVKPAEHDEIARVLVPCASPSTSPGVSGTTVADSERPISESSSSDPSVIPTTSVLPDIAGPFANCAAARAAGAAPMSIGDPGYSADMDGDGDGVACE